MIATSGQLYQVTTLSALHPTLNGSQGKCHFSGFVLDAHILVGLILAMQTHGCVAGWVCSNVNLTVGIVNEVPQLGMRQYARI